MDSRVRKVERRKEKRYKVAFKIKVHYVPPNKRKDLQSLRTPEGVGGAVHKHKFKPANFFGSTKLEQCGCGRYREARNNET